MRRVILAESAGFCYGVCRAVKLAEETAAATAGGCRMLGDLIHNTHVVEDLARQGRPQGIRQRGADGRGHRHHPLPRGA
ncbi:MAG: hypothetical protein V8R40_08460 [Dysosmobacter sp.]